MTKTRSLVGTGGLFVRIFMLLSSDHNVTIDDPVCLNDPKNDPKCDPTGPSQANLELIAASGLFDGDWYLDRNPDVRASGMNALTHYLTYGSAQGRDPSASFSTQK